MFTEYLQSLKSKRAAVCGLGVSNRPLVETLLSAGISVTGRDLNTVDIPGLTETVFGDDYLDHIDEDVVFRSPGIRPDKFLLKPGAELTSEMEVFFSVCPCPIIAVTGSDGKTTVTTLIAELLRAEGYTVHLGGNIGTPLLTRSDTISPDDFAVAELSSFQLATMRQSPHIAVITNISPNHLDWHTDYAEYVSAKSNILKYQRQGDVLVLNESLRGLKTELGYEDSSAELRWYHETSDIPYKPAKLRGEHNVWNFNCAVTATRHLIGSHAIEQVAADFAGVPHRLELARELDGIAFVNDSIASSANRTIAGLRSFTEPVILIAGGKDKGVSYDAVGAVIRERVKRLILIGPTAVSIRAAVEAAGGGVDTIVTDDFSAAVRAAYAAAVPGDVVLLSPASTSFDRWKNFEERGNAFKRIVNQL
ncbi:MAG: UDP-N-acetylmuramoyl-L-alanine--D-glutamate ligase [Oscillospiraceae bacterium]|jgi:UDP-N-acetylmuramoylalanine--D-glutamate ligase|nr:UDP-N-acetylmuramoyl-L-alanine--D-glutamate ligase [Oscillospiraceae bacterium]